MWACVTSPVPGFSPLSRSTTSLARMNSSAGTVSTAPAPTRVRPGDLRLVNTATSGYFAVLQHRREGPELQVLYLWSLVVSHGYDHQSLPAVAERVT